MRTRLIPSSSDSAPSPTAHRSVLLSETIALLDIRPHDVVLDATLGGAGHARAISSKLGPEGILVGMDLDRDAIGRARDALKNAPHRVILIETNFRFLRHELEREGIAKIDRALFDFGWSSYQMTGRGFSFLADEPLQMAYSKSGADFTASDIINGWQEDSIADVLYGFGQERHSRKIARAIVDRRQASPIKTARELTELIKSSVPLAYRFGRIHPATKSFQALRIAVNDELGALRQGLTEAWNLSGPSGRIAAISFHSLEDRAVKELFAGFAADKKGTRITKSPVVATSEELKENPRARSAKLRVIEKAA